MANFRITYYGAALETSEMDVRELAPALLAMGELLKASSAALGSLGKPQVNVKGSFKVGSFGVDFSLLVDFADKAREWFLNDKTQAAATAVTILSALGFVAGGARHGLFYILKWVRGRKIDRVEIARDSATLYVGDDTLKVDLLALKLLQDLAVRRAARTILAPLEKNGVDAFAVGTDSVIAETIRKNELAFFEAPALEDELLLDDTRKMVFSIVSLAFKEDNKWRLHDGAATIHAAILDDDFLNKVNCNQIAFTKSDVLICLVRVRQWQTSTGAKTDYEVIEVIEHRSAARQLSLPGLD